MASASATIVMWLLALSLGAAVWRKDSARVRDGVRLACERFVTIMPRIVLALVMAGFVAKLTPSDPIAALIGPESGWKGILIASLTGGFVPAGPIIAFPFVVVLSKAGAGTPQLIAFVTAWSVFAFHRVMIYETAMMGWRFSVIRLTSSLILPPLAGFLATGLALLISRG